MNTSKFPLNFAQQSQQQTQSQQSLSNGKSSNPLRMLSNDLVKNIDPNLLAQFNRSLLSNPSMLNMQMKQQMRKLEQQKYQEQQNAANMKASFDMLSQRMSKSK